MNPRLALLFACVLGAGTVSADEVVGATLPAPIDGVFFGGTSVDDSDTWVTPFVATAPGRIVKWKGQFYGAQLASCGLPLTVQLKVLRATSITTVQVVAAGAVHSPKAILEERTRLSCPMLADASPESVIEFAETDLPVETGDLVGVTVTAAPDAPSYALPMLDSGSSRLILRNAAPGATIELADAHTGMSPALQISIASADADGDGVADANDACPSSKTGAAVDREGCSLADLCPCARPLAGLASWASHGAYVSCFVREADRFDRAGLFGANARKGVEVAEAARSSCGYPSANGAVATPASGARPGPAVVSAPRGK